jgi:hypothetical protein
VRSAVRIHVYGTAQCSHNRTYFTGAPRLWRLVPLAPSRAQIRGFADQQSPPNPERALSRGAQNAFSPPLERAQIWYIQLVHRSKSFPESPIARMAQTKRFPHSALASPRVKST